MSPNPTTDVTQPAEAGQSPIVELRQYSLYPGRRDELIELFDRHLVESQEAVGIRVIGQFRDVEDRNRFVWLRGFRDMATRADSLAAFYGGPVWKQHRDAANATMVDSSDALLLRPSHPGYGFAVAGCERPPATATIIPAGFVMAAIYSLASPMGEAVREPFERDIRSAVNSAGGSLLAFFVTEPSQNTFPALPVREDETVVVWFAGFPERSDLRAVLHDAPMRGVAGAGIAIRLSQLLRLTATARSMVTPSSPGLSTAR